MQFSLPKSASVTLVVLVAIVVVASNNGHAISDSCQKRVGDLERCLPKLVVYGDRKFEPPRDEKQMDKHCALLDENLKCVNSYSRECLPVFARSIYSVFLRRLKAQFGKRCKTKDGREDFINLMACADAKHMEPAHKCMDSFVAQLEHIEKGKNQSVQVEHICCTFQLFEECIFAASKKMSCSHRVVSAEKAIDYVHGLINTMGGDIMEFMCGKFSTLAACSAGHPTTMSDFRRISREVESGRLKAQSSTPLKPMLELFANSQPDD